MFDYESNRATFVLCLLHKYWLHTLHWHWRCLLRCMYFAIFECCVLVTRIITVLGRSYIYLWGHKFFWSWGWCKVPGMKLLEVKTLDWPLLTALLVIWPCRLLALTKPLAVLWLILLAILRRSPCSGLGDTWPADSWSFMTCHTWRTADTRVWWVNLDPRGV